MTSPFLDPRALAVVQRLHAEDRRQRFAVIWHFLRRLAGSLARRASLELNEKDNEFLSDKLVSLKPAKCELCYLLCRALGARRVVEVGTSFGVSTIYLAAAVRDNGGEGETGIVFGTEIEPRKVTRARANFAAAGLAPHIDLREGDALATLAAIDGPFDFALIDTWIPVALPALRLLVPKLRSGAVIACDNTVQFRKEYADYLSFVRNPESGLRSMSLPYAGGLELSMKVSPSGGESSQVSGAASAS